MWGQCIIIIVLYSGTFELMKDIAVLSFIERLSFRVKKVLAAYVQDSEHLGPRKVSFIERVFFIRRVLYQRSHCIHHVCTLYTLNSEINIVFCITRTWIATPLSSDWVLTTSRRTSWGCGFSSCPTTVALRSC